MMRAARLLTTIVSTGFIAFASGYIIQSGEDTATRIGESMQSSGMARASTSLDPLSITRATEAALQASPFPRNLGLNAHNADIGRSCSATFLATPMRGAMLRLSLNAPCAVSEPVTIRHQGLTFTELTSPEGRLILSVPALTVQARVEAVMQNGQRFSTTTEVPDALNFTRVGLMWRGETGLQIHAQDENANHVWAGAPGQLGSEDGYLMALGDRSLPNATRAEVYTFPAAASEGVVALSVQADVQNTNCGAMIAAQSLQPDGHGSVFGTDLTLHLPECAQIGQSHVFEDVFQTLTLASK